MQMVVSQAWTKDDGPDAEAYIQKSQAFHGFLEAQPGFVSRVLIRGTEDRTHFYNLRTFESIDHYLAMTELSEYHDHISDLSMHVDVERYTDGYPREFADVVLATPPLPGA